MKAYLTYLLMLTTHFCNAQINDLPDIENFIRFKHRMEKGDTIANNRFWENNTPKVTYVKTGDKLIRRQFYTNGKIESKAEIIQGIGIDTTTQIKNNNQEIVILKTLIDIGHGIYHEYYSNGNIKLKGKLLQGRKIDEWVMYDKKQNKVIVNYNRDSEISGKYFEYKYEPKSKTYHIKIEGAYKVVEYKEGKRLKRESRRSGHWKYYSEEGQLIDEAIYKN